MAGLYALGVVVAAFALAVLPREGDEPAAGRDPDWLWPLDPTLDRSDRTGARHRRTRRRVPDWPAANIVDVLSALGPVYPFEGLVGTIFTTFDEVLEDVVREIEQGSRP